MEVNIPALKPLGLVLSAVLVLACSPAEDTRIEGPMARGETPNVYWPTPQSPIGKDPKAEKKIAEILARMSLEQKIGQMMQPSIDHITPEEVTQYYIGSVLNGGGMYPNKDRYASPHDWMALANEFWDAARNMPEGVPAIPLLWGTDAVHGHNNVVGATLFPHNSALGAANNTKLVREIGEAVAREMVATGLDWNFAPTVAIAKSLRWGRAYESFSENPGIAAQLSAAMVIGLQGEPSSERFLANDRVIATAKHFIGDGATERGDDQGSTQLSEQALINEHVTGYLSTISSGVQTVMASYSSWQGVPMHAQKYLLTDVLKNHMGFDGFVISDWNATGHVEGCTRDNCATAINAGVDMLMVPTKPDWPNMIANTLSQVKNGDIAIERIDDAVTRILRVKMRAGLFQELQPSTRTTYSFGDTLSTAAHQEIARQAVRESLVLLKNNNKTLPLAADGHILVTGNAADSVAMQSGGWTISWQGNDTKPEDFPAATSIYQGLLYTTRSAGGSVELSEDGSYRKRPDAAVVVFGEEPYAEMRGDLQNLKTLEYNREYAQALMVLSTLKAEGIPTVSVFVSGRPRLVAKEMNQSDAFVMAWLPGSEGQGIADVLLDGAQGFKGKLPFSWPSQPCPNSDGNNPPPLHPLGFGLNYQSDVQTPQLNENYPPFINGCDLPDQPLQVEGYDLSGSDMNLHLELKSLEKVVVNTETSWQGLNAKVSRTGDKNIEQIDLVWAGAPRVNAVLQNGRVQSFVPNLVADQSLAFEVNIRQSANETVWLKMECGHLCSEQIDVTEPLKALTQNEWHPVYVPLSCIADHRTDLHKINSPFRIDSSGNLSLSLRNMRVGKVKPSAINLCLSQ